MDPSISTSRDSEDHKGKGNGGKGTAKGGKATTSHEGKGKESRGSNQSGKQKANDSEEEFEEFMVGLFGDGPVYRASNK